MSVLKVLHTEENTLRNTVLKLINLEQTSGTKTLKLNNLYVQNGDIDKGPLIIHYTDTGSPVTLPIQASGLLYTVDWGDGTVENLAVDNPTHTYAVSQSYIIKIYIVTQGIIVSFRESLTMWQGVTSFPSLGNERYPMSMFYAANITLTFPQQVTTDIELWDTSQVIRMNLMFAYSSFNGAIGNWNTKNVISMSQMFQGTTSFDQPLNNWNTKNVTNMSRMFYVSSSMSMVNIETIKYWNVSAVTNMSNMFSTSIDTQVFTNILEGWKTNGVQSNVTMGVYSLQTAFAANGLQAYYNSKNWTFKDQGGNTINIWI